MDYLPGLTSAEKKDRLWRISYKDFLLNLVKVNPGVDSVLPDGALTANGESASTPNPRSIAGLTVSPDFRE